MTAKEKFARNTADAENKSKRYGRTDPLPSIPCSLLSSAEISDYARITGMLYPFYTEALKSASYEAHVGGEVIWWEDGVRHKEDVFRGGELVLPPNSIKFVQVEPIFRLPNYIAVRFNLRIALVHRGLLLRTGPLVDPGFEGKLLIPLHNLTSTPCRIDTNDALIWLEFTKTTFGFTPLEAEASKVREFRSFPENKKNLLPDTYLQKASAGAVIQSSIPVAILEAQRIAKIAQSTVKRLGFRITLGVVVGTVALAIALVQLVIAMNGLIQGAVSLYGPNRAEIQALTAAQRAAWNEQLRLRSDLSNLRRDLQSAHADEERLKRELSALDETHSARKNVPNSSTSATNR